MEVLISRINLLKGVSCEQIFKKLDLNNYLINGAKELFAWLKQNEFITVLHTGNILPVANYYKKLLNIDYLVCTNPKMKDNIIEDIESKDFNDPNFKFNGCLKIANNLNINKNDIYAIGDSAVDKIVFELAGHCIAINAKGGIEKFANYEIKNGDLNEVIDYLKTH